jgi:hypothetical protein
MGITIHYHGILKDRSRLPELISSLKSASLQLDWPCDEINERVVGTLERLESQPDPQDPHTSFTITHLEPLDDRWRGVIIQPPGCETLYFTFNTAGHLIVFHAQFNSPPGTYWAQELLFCKTQFASPDIHIAVCNLLRLVEPFMSEWTVSDETGYFESGDRAEMERLMNQMSALIEHLGSELGREDLENILGQDVPGNIEVAKKISEIPPVWRESWGDTAHEN